MNKFIRLLVIGYMSSSTRLVKYDEPSVRVMNLDYIRELRDSPNGVVVTTAGNGHIGGVQFVLDSSHNLDAVEADLRSRSRNV